MKVCKATDKDIESLNNTLEAIKTLRNKCVHKGLLPREKDTIEHGKKVYEKRWIGEYFISVGWKSRWNSLGIRAWWVGDSLKIEIGFMAVIIIFGNFWRRIRICCG